ncbi:hypothetical protein [[Phormidium] sp. ETS-05]|uniref:hypothetical protein n=1 Tax=[Phormidium] sp. ETS-05 TaxID=222819 RepID=UPI0018EEE9E0|nr:hypothetical protein [[Phormidium] sp. ETS-05]
MLFELSFLVKARHQQFCRVGSANYRTLVIKRIIRQALPTLLLLNFDVCCLNVPETGFLHLVSAMMQKLFQKPGF